MTKLFMGFLLVLLMSAQTADVVILKIEDSIGAEDAWKALKLAEHQWADINARVKKVYGISYDAEFSKDFKAVVPRTWSGSGMTGSLHSQNYYYGSGWGTVYPLYCYPSGSIMTSNVSGTSNALPLLPSSGETAISGPTQ
jgi:hypothetical protein